MPEEIDSRVFHVGQAFVYFFLDRFGKERRDSPARISLLKVTVAFNILFSMTESSFRKIFPARVANDEFVERCVIFETIRLRSTFFFFFFLLTCQLV